MKIRGHRTSFASTASRCAIIFSLLFAWAGKSDGQWVRVNPPSPGKNLRVLFIGNSLTSANDLPHMVQALANAAGKTMQIESVIIGGANLEDHWNDGGAQRAIASQRWSVVVLQQGPSSLPESRVHLRTWTKKFDELIRKAGGRTALYMVWPEQERSAFFDDVRDSYSIAAQDVKGIFFPAGEALRAAQRRDPRAPLFSSDGFHPTVAGTYAAALSIYGVLYRQAPQGLPAQLRLANGQVVTVPQTLAALLQDAATEANQTYGRP
jgi:hypothetical protein